MGRNDFVFAWVLLACCAGYAVVVDPLIQSIFVLAVIVLLIGRSAIYLSKALKQGK